MLKTILLLLIFVIISACQSTANNINKSSKICKMVYSFNNPSLGPVNGNRKLKLTIKDDKIISVKDLQNKNGTPGVKVIQKVLAKDTKGLIVTYDKRGVIKSIKPKLKPMILGGSYVIKILDYKCN